MYKLGMYKVSCCIFLAGLSLYGQLPPAAASLTPALSKALATSGTLDDSVSQSLVNAMMSIALQQHQPTRQEVDALANALRGAMAGRDIPGPDASALSQCLVDLLRGDGKSNFALASQLRDELTALHVGDQKTDLIVRRFVAIGEAVRGPDDMPAKDRINLSLPLKTK